MPSPGLVVRAEIRALKLWCHPEGTREPEKIIKQGSDTIRFFSGRNNSGCAVEDFIQGAKALSQGVMMRTAAEETGTIGERKQDN